MTENILPVTSSTLAEFPPVDVVSVHWTFHSLADLRAFVLTIRSLSLLTPSPLDYTHSDVNII